MARSSVRAELSATRRGGARRKVLVALVVVVVIVVGLVIAAPSILSRFAGGMIERAASAGIAGKVEVQKVSLSWAGPQRVGSIVLDDPSGRKVGEVSARLDAGLLGLVTGSRDLGMVRVRGLIDLRHEASGELNLASAMASAGKGSPITVPPGGARPTPASTPSEVRLPKGLVFQVDASELEIRYTPPGADSTPVGFKTTKAAGAFAADKPSDFELEAQTLDGRRALTVDFHADRLTDDRGLLALRDAKLELSIDADLSAGDTDALARMIAGEAQAGITVGPAPDAGVKLNAKLVSRDGRLTLSHPATLTGRIPALLLETIPVGDARVHFDAAPRATIAIQKLDLPLPKAGSLFDADFRDAVLDVAMSTDPITGTAAVAGGEPQAFTIDLTEPKLQQMDRLFDQIVTCSGSATFGELKAGRFELDLRAAGLLDEQGRLRIGPFAPQGEGYALIPGPEYLRGVLRVYEFPTALVQPLVEKTGIVLDEVAGPTMAMDIRAGVRQGTSELPKEVTTSEGEKVELPPVGEPYLAATLDSRYTTAWLDFRLVGGRLMTRNRGAKIQTNAAAALLRPFLPADQVSLLGTGKAIIDLSDVDIPMTGSTPDLRAASGNYRIVVGDLDVQTSPNVSPLHLNSLDTACGLSPNETPTWGVDWRATYEGKKFAIVGNGDLPGMIPDAGETGDFYGLSLRDARPTGKLKLLDVPTEIATLFSERVARIADAAAGASLKGSIESLEHADSGARVDVTIEGDRGVVQGAFEASRDAITLDDKGIAVTLFDPGLLLNTLTEGGERAPALAFNDTGRATLTVSDTTIPLRGLGSAAPLKGIAASAKLEASDLSGAVRSDNRTAQLAITSLDAGAALTPSGDLTVKIESDGRIDQEATTSSGSIAVRGLRGDDGRLDLAHASFDGAWSAHNIPTSLIALVSPDNAEILRQTVGEAVDVTLTPQTGGTPTRGGWDVKAAGRDFSLASRVALGANTLELGPTSARASLTPQAVEAAMAAYQPELSPRPRLASAVPLELSADTVSIPLKDGYRPDFGDELTLAGSLQAAGDLVLANLPGVSDDATSMLGLRELQVSAKPNAGKTNVALSSTVFDPSTNRAVASLSGSTSLPMTTLSGQLSLIDADNAALDSMLATKGLLSEVAGDRLTLDVRAIAPEEGETVPLAAQVDSPRLKVDAELTRSDEGIALTRPAHVNWLVTKETAQRLLFPTKEGEKPKLKVNNDFNVALNVATLRTGPPSGPLRRDVFRLASEVHLDPISFTETAKDEEVTLPAREGRIAVDPATGALTIMLAGVAGQAAPGPGADEASAGALSIDATIEDYADEAGKPTFDQARLTSTVTGEMPTALVDALADASGLLTALVGPRMTADIQTTDFSQKAGTGTVRADVRAPYANLQIEGRMEPGEGAPVFATTKPGRVELARISNEASEQLLGVLFPLLTRFEKTANDQPGVITAEGLTLPLSHDTRELNGVLHVDPGTMEFETKGFFSKILKKTHNVQAGQIGKKLKPFDITIERGVARYQDVIIPSGEFDLVTSGKVNLNKRRMDVYVFVPIFATNDNLASLVKNIPGVGELTRVPVRVKGGFDDPDVSVDPNEMLRSLPKNVGSGIEDVLRTPGNILDQLFGNKSKDDERKKDGTKSDGGGS